MKKIIPKKWRCMNDLLITKKCNFKIQNTKIKIGKSEKI